MDRILQEAASNIYPNTLYDDALEILNTIMAKNNMKNKINRHMDCQSMLVYNDPMVQTVLSINPHQSFKKYLQVFNAVDWKKLNPYNIRLAGKQYIFPSRRACMLFCYHPKIVRRWYQLPGAPKNIRIPNKSWTFATKPIEKVFFDQAEWEAFLQVKHVPEGVLWGDLMMSDDESE